jgi:hypothetical protein
MRFQVEFKKWPNRATPADLTCIESVTVTVKDAKSDDDAQLKAESITDLPAEWFYVDSIFELGL